jgi:mono/diheme cytochrome c family protein
MMSRSSAPQPKSALKLAALVMLSVASSLSGHSLNDQAAKGHHPPGMFDQVLAMHHAVVRGDLRALRSPAAWFAEHGLARSRAGETEVPEESLKLAAARAAAATDVSRAGAAVADLVGACGSCHETLQVTPRLPAIARPGHTSIVGHMLRHEQAAEQMLHGLVMPSDSLWLQGTTAFAETPLRAGDFPVDFERGEKMARVEADVHQLAQSALAAETLSSRARAYAQLLGTCAACHQRHARP